MNLPYIEKPWPELPYDEWRETYETLQRWMQVVGKIQLKLRSYINQWWEVAFHVSSRGLRTGPMPWQDKLVEIEFDFIDHVLTISCSDGRHRAMALAPRSVADFYLEMMELLASLGINLNIDREPKEIPNPIPFDQDRRHATYERELASRHWQILTRCHRLFERFRGGYSGKASPVLFFWGTFDLTISRFSGRLAPPRPGVDHVTQLAYSDEIFGCGFWPGSGNILEPAFYAHVWPEPEAYPRTQVTPSEAFYNEPTRGFILKYDQVRTKADPDRTILEFCQSTYDPAANLAKWDRQRLERKVFHWPGQAASGL